MQFSFSLELGHDATTTSDDVAALLEKSAQKIREDGALNGKLFDDEEETLHPIVDRNGNKVGAVRVQAALYQVSGADEPVTLQALNEENGGLPASAVYELEALSPGESTYIDITEVRRIR